MALKIFKYGADILREKLPELKELPKDFDQLIEDMYDIMYENNGIGLSANQVGKVLNFCIVDFSLYDEKMKKMVFINPKILKLSDEKIIDTEGCLSIPDINEKVIRSKTITVQYETKGRETIEDEFVGYPARVIQHEIDHLNGVLFVDRVSPLKRSFIASKLKRIAIENK